MSVVVHVIVARVGHLGVSDALKGVFSFLNGGPGGVEGTNCGFIVSGRVARWESVSAVSWTVDSGLLSERGRAAGNVRYDAWSQRSGSSLFDASTLQPFF